MGGAVGDVGRDRPLLRGGWDVAVSGGTVEEVRREFGTPNTDIPAQGEAMIGVWGEN
jgi:hypothetical protein